MAKGIQFFGHQMPNRQAKMCLRYFTNNCSIQTAYVHYPSTVPVWSSSYILYGTSTSVLLHRPQYLQRTYAFSSYVYILYATPMNLHVWYARTNPYIWYMRLKSLYKVATALRHFVSMKGCLLGSPVAAATSLLY